MQSYRACGTGIIIKRVEEEKIKDDMVDGIISVVTKGTIDASDYTVVSVGDKVEMKLEEGDRVILHPSAMGGVIIEQETVELKTTKIINIVAGDILAVII